MARAAPAAALLLCGCFQYVPATQSTVAPGATVRVGLTQAGTADLSPVIGSSVVAVEGRVTSPPRDTLTMRVSRLLTAAGVAVDWTGQEGAVGIPRTAVASVERQVVARRRTAVLVGGAALAGVVLWQWLKSNTESSTPGSDGGGGPIFIIR